MEYLIAFLALLSTVGFAVFIAVNIEKGKSWAIEIAQAVSVLDPSSLEHNLRQRHAAVRTEAASIAAEQETPAKAGSDDERLAA